MNIYKLVLECIELYPEDEPIFIHEVKEYVVKKCKNEENENVDKWVETVLSERGSKIIEDAGYVPVENIEDNNIESTSKLETAYNTIINAQGENAEALILFPETSDDYIEVYEFPCCGLKVAVGDGPVSRFRADGCCCKKKENKYND